MRALSYLNKYFIKYKWRFLLGILFTIASNYFGAKMPIIVKESVDEMMKDFGNDPLGNTLLLSLKIGGIYMLMSLGKGFFLFLMRQTIIIMSRFIEYDLKNEIYAQYQRLDFNFFKKNSTGDLMNRISEDVSQVRMYLGPGIMYTINLAILFTMVIYQMIQISPILSLYVLLPLPLMSFLIYKVSSRMNQLSSEVQKEQSFMSTLVQETFSGIRVIKAYSREAETGDRFNNSAENYKLKSMRLVLTNALFMPTIMFLIGLSTLLAIYLGGKMSHQNEISIGGIVAFIFFVNNLTWPFASVGWVTSIIQRAAASQTRINEFLKQQPEIVNQSNDQFELQGNIEFRNVTLTYPNSKITALENLSFSVSSGETLAVIGRTGSGKSSILHVLMRQVDPQQGEVMIDGKDLRTINLNSFRDQTGTVPQDVFLFSDTIGNNIRFGAVNRVPSDEEVESVARMAHVHHNIVEFPEKYDTLLGERGVNLSGGQKQRVSIARALIRDPRLLLLDDCLSAVDTETEEIILRNLDQKENRTTIIVSHRVSSIRNANRIIVIDHGRKIEEGTHHELLALNGHYAEMYRKQLSEENG